MDVPLRERACVPCRGGTEPLGLAEAEALLAEIPDWRLLDVPMRIEREWRFRSFGGAFAFVQAVAGLAESERHHPDIRVGWGYAHLSLHTHAVAGLHENDFILAAKLDAMQNPAG